MNVEDWLRQSGLSGKKLEHAVASAEENFVESIAELKALAADREQFNLVFPQGMIRSVILKALDGGETNGNSPPSQISHAAPPQQASAPANTKGGLTLPPNKKFHTFCSHKKTHTRFGDSCEVRS